MHVRGNIPSNLLAKHFFSNNVEGPFVELNFRKGK